MLTKTIMGVLVLFWLNKKKHNSNGLKNYVFADNWMISVPTDWCYEIDQTDGNQILLYDSRSDLTFRISTMHAENEGELCPKENMLEAFLSSSKYTINKVDGFDRDGILSATFSCQYEENGVKVHWSSYGFADDGTLVTVNIFSTDELKIDNSLKYVLSICRK